MATSFDFVTEQVGGGYSQPELWRDPLKKLFDNCVKAADIPAGGDEITRAQETVDRDHTFIREILRARSTYCNANFLAANPTVSKEVCFRMMLRFPDHANIQTALGDTLTNIITQACKNPRQRVAIPKPLVSFEELKSTLLEDLQRNVPEVTVTLSLNQWNAIIAMTIHPESLKELRADDGRPLSSEKQEQVVRIVNRIDSLMQRKRSVSLGEIVDIVMAEASWMANAAVALLGDLDKYRNVLTIKIR